MFASLYTIHNATPVKWELFNGDASHAVTNAGIVTHGSANTRPRFCLIRHIFGKKRWWLWPYREHIEVAPCIRSNVRKHFKRSGEALLIGSKIDPPGWDTFHMNNTATSRFRSRGTSQFWSIPCGIHPRQTRSVLQNWCKEHYLVLELKFYYIYLLLIYSSTIGIKAGPKNYFSLFMAIFFPNHSEGPLPAWISNKDTTADIKLIELRWRES